MAFTDTPPVFSVPRHELHILRYLYVQPQMAQLVLQVGSRVDTDALTLTINGRSTTFEYDNNSSVTAGRVAVPIGGTGPTNGANLAAAVSSVYGDVVRFVNDNAWEYIIANTPDCDLSGVVVTGTMGLDKGVVARPQQPMAVAFINRLVGASDVTKGNTNLYTGIDTIYYLNVILRASGGNPTPILYNGTVTITGELVQFAQGTTTGVYAAGNVFQCIVMGDKVE